MIEAGLIDALRGSNSLLCISHVNPDGDAVGSLLGMGWLLRSLDKRPTLALQHDVPDEMLELPGASEVITASNEEFTAKVVNQPFDLIVCLDASSPDRMGTAYNPDLHGRSPMLVIDHHVTNTYFGDVNWVAPECAATCQMLVYLAETLNIPLAEDLAECLLTGLVTDTLGFRTSNTDAAVLDAATRLMRGGANLAQITERTLNRRPFSLIRLWGLVLPTTRLEERVVWATVSRGQFTAAEHAETDAKLSSFLVTASEANMSAVFCEKLDDDGRLAIECSFRAKPGFDVSKVAFSLAGGGHPPASGCTVYGELHEVAADVVATLQAAQREQAQQRADQLRGSTA